MTHTVTVSQQAQLEEYFVLRAIRVFDGQYENQKKVIAEKEFNAEPTLEDIAQFLVESGADFASKVVNYRVVNEDIPFAQEN